MPRWSGASVFAAFETTTPMLKVMVVEDTATYQLIIRRQLSVSGIRSVVPAADGAEALELLRKEPDVDVIICDWHMAPMDGLAFCAAVQSVPYLRGRRIPVVLMTGDAKLADPDRRRRALEPAKGLGITEILIKPFSAETLREVLGRCADYRPW